VFLLGFQSKGQGHLFIAVELCHGRRSPFRWRGNLICNTVCTWSMRSLSATGSADTSAAGQMTPFQPVSYWRQRHHCSEQALRLHSAPVGCYTTMSYGI
jgi:hypothetical protein